MIVVHGLSRSSSVDVSKKEGDQQKGSGGGANRSRSAEINETVKEG